jgi:hypothetical protein
MEDIFLHCIKCDAGKVPNIHDMISQDYDVVKKSIENNYLINIYKCTCPQLDQMSKLGKLFVYVQSENTHSVFHRPNKIIIKNNLYVREYGLFDLREIDFFDSNKKSIEIINNYDQPFINYTSTPKFLNSIKKGTLIKFNPGLFSFLELDEHLFNNYWYLKEINDGLYIVDSQPILTKPAKVSKNE